LLPPPLRLTRASRAAAAPRRHAMPPRRCHARERRHAPVFRAIFAIRRHFATADCHAADTVFARRLPMPRVGCFLIIFYTPVLCRHFADAAIIFAALYL